MLADDIQPAPCAAFLQNGAHVELGRTFADAELRGNLLIGSSLQDQSKNLALPGRELQGRFRTNVVFRKTPGYVLIYVLVECLHGTSHGLQKFLFQSPLL